MSLAERQGEMLWRIKWSKISRAGKLKARIIHLANTHPLLDYTALAALAAKGRGYVPTKQYVSQVLLKAGYRRVWRFQKPKPGKFTVERTPNGPAKFRIVPAKDYWCLKTVLLKP